VCAVQSRLPGQFGAGMQFATPPRELDPDDAGGKGLGDCSGYVEPGRGEYGYATVDIYFLEVCILSFICSNGAELFQLDEMVEWRCAFSNSRFNELQRILLTAREEGHSCHKWG